MNRKLLTSVAALLCLGALAGGTTAYFTDSEATYNVITSGKIDIALQEWADAERTQPFPEQALTGVMPGDTVTKIVQVENICAQPAFIRVKVDTQLLTQDGTELPNAIGLDLNERDWITGQDGYYYYRTILDGHALTQPLFTAVHFDAQMDNRYQGCSVRIGVTAYATQSRNNGTDPLLAAGWPED